jgi:hypothetical protein
LLRTISVAFYLFKQGEKIKLMENLNQEGEIWKEIQFQNKPSKKYEISNQGRIRSFDPKKDQYKILRQSNVKGYKAYSFRFEDKGTKLMHRLVAEYFLDRDNNLQKYVIHLDYNKSNNSVENLKWVTKETLSQHHRLNPNYTYDRPRRVTNSKLNETQVIRLKKKLKRGKNPLYKIAKEFGITHTQLNRIRSGENWGHIKVE